MKTEKQKVVISGSASLSRQMKYWRDHWTEKGRVVLAWPKPISPDAFRATYPIVHKEFYTALTCTDIHFVANETKDGIEGYIGPGVFAEISFRIGLNLVKDENVPIILLQIPSPGVSFYGDIMLWKSLGWLRIFDSETTSEFGL